ncbi:MAG: ABC transporter ATP-binding protein [Methanophagales archaeon]|nr:ABC transporter ATP-binding protein [Methanophagales archaeon]
MSYHKHNNYIELDNVSFSYPRSRVIIKDITLQLVQNEFTALIGPNGGGKTTLGKLAIGILKPTSGKVFICGKDSTEMTLGEISRKIGYLFQNPQRQLFALTVAEDIAFSLEWNGGDRAERRIGIGTGTEIERKVNNMLELFQLEHLRDASPFSLSHGEKERVALAGIFINQLDYFVLDEPTTGLDIERKKILDNILNKFRTHGIGILAISHDEDLVAQHADRIIEIADGEIVYDHSERIRP